MKLKIKDIAKRAGVSTTAVSFALNGKEGISDQTREKILRIVEEAGYASKVLEKREKQLNREAENVSKLILLLYPTNTDNGAEESEDVFSFYEIMQKVEKQIHKYHYNLFFKSIVMTGDYCEEIEKIITFYQVEGMIIVGAEIRPEQIKNISKINTPMVVVGQCFRQSNIDCLAFDNYTGAYEAVAYLIENNHKNIRYVGTESRSNNFEERKKGYSAAMAEHGLESYIKCCLWDKNGENIDFIREIREDMPSAFLAENDYLAVEMIKEFQQTGIKVPEEVSVMGFDNIVVANLVAPELTTMNISWERMAELSVKRLMEKIKGENKGALKIILAAELIERKSCRQI